MGLNYSEVFICYHALGNSLGRRNFLNSSYYVAKAHSCIVYGRENLRTDIPTRGIGDNQLLDNVTTTIGNPEVHPKRRDTWTNSC
jgi:hypothetical protein